MSNDHAAFISRTPFWTFPQTPNMSNPGVSNQKQPKKRARIESISDEEENVSPQTKLKNTHQHEMDQEYEDEMSSVDGEIYGGSKEQAKGRNYLAIQEDIVIKDNMPPSVTTNVLWANVKPSCVSL